MIKFTFLTCLAILTIISGCQQNRIEVLGVSSTDMQEIVQDAPIVEAPRSESGEQEFVYNGGPGSTEVIYEDLKGKQRTGFSNVIKVPMHENCEEEDDTPKFRDLTIVDIPEMPAIPEMPDYLVSVDTFQNCTISDAHIGPDVVYQTDVFIPKTPPKVELTKSSDEDQLCCNDQLTYRIKFKNTGGMDAYNIRIDDVIPAKVMYLEETAGFDIYQGEVEIERDYDSIARKISWIIPGPIAPGAEGEVFYSVECSHPIPKLSCYIRFEPTFLGLGEEGSVICQVMNNGDGPAENVVATFNIPLGLECEIGTGRQATVQFGTVGAGETVEKTIKVRMIGMARLDDMTVTLRADNAMSCSCEVPPTATMTIEKSGPSLVTNRVPIEYTIVVTNTSTKNAMATACVLTDKLPEFVTFKSASDGGTYDKESHTVTWMLGDLKPEQKVIRTVIIIPEQVGTFKDHAQVTCAEGITITDDAITIVRGISALHIDSYDTEDPVEVGGTTTYVIEVMNEGFQDVTGLVVVNEIPNSTEFVDGTGRDPEGNVVNCRVDGKNVIFEAIQKLAPAEKALYKVTVKVKAEAQLLNMTKIKYNEFSKTLIVEEPTHSYEP
ncbi:MAG TPA: hypothetical protein PKM32_02275 [Planctomycetota bacterium]|nr:hypothetical protein [Planctomycetota bacterium]